MAPSDGRTLLCFRSLILVTVSLVYFLILHPEVGSNVLPKIAVKQLLASGADCTDNTGAVVGNGAQWPSTADACDVNVCWHSVVYNFVISYSCPSYTDSDNPDKTNCYLNGNTSLAFPYCCPTLVCNSSTPLATNSSDCKDFGSSFACSVWYNMTDGCQSGVDGYNDRIYNFTRDYCNKTCGFC